MTPERQQWWDSLPMEEKRVRLLIKTLKENINCCKQTIADEWAAITNKSQNGKNQLKAAKDNLRDTKRAIKALRTQIAMNVIAQHNGCWEYYICPHCYQNVRENNQYREYDRHCWCCGQKLRWE